MNKQKVLVVGSGYAGRGHAEAFRYVGAEVVGMVGRTAEVVKTVASEMGISHAGTSLTEALEACRPDIVAIATPGGAHFEPIMEAMDKGCHIFCDKPLAETAERARILCDNARTKGIKTAYAASYRYMPAVLYAKELIAEGTIGEPQEAEFISHFDLDPNIPFGWSHRLAMGGGRLNNNFTHLLSIATHVLGEKILTITGEVRNDMPRAPIVEGVHNFIERRKFIPKDLNDPSLKWADVDAEWSYTVQATIEADYPSKNPVSVLFKHGGLHPRFHEDHSAIYGSEGGIYIKGHYGNGPLYLHSREDGWKEVPVPDRIVKDLPDIADDTQRNWTHLADKLVADIEGRSSEPYQTFRDGCMYQEIIEIIRSNGTRIDFRSS